MLQQLTPHLPQIISALIGLFIGWLYTRLAAAGKLATAAERLKSEERRTADTEARLALSASQAEINSPKSAPASKAK